MTNIKTVVPNTFQYDAKLGYTTYEVEQGELRNGVVENTPSSEAEHATIREANGQACVDLPISASVSFTVRAGASTAAVRYVVPGGEGGKIEVKVSNTVIDTLDLSSKSNWQYLGSYEYHPDGDIKVHSTPAADRFARSQFNEVS